MSDHRAGTAKAAAQLTFDAVALAGSQVADTVALRRIDAYTLERIDKKAGKVVGTTAFVFSKDGKTRTLTTKATNAKGAPINNVVVSEKQ